MLAQLSDEIRQILIEALDADISVYIGDLPGLSDAGIISVQMSEGRDPQRFFGRYPPVYYPTLRLLTRAPTHDYAAELCDLAIAALDGYDSDTMSVMLIGSPLGLGQNEQLCDEFQQYFKITVK